MLLRRLVAEATASPARLLDATRMIGVGVTAALGQFLVDNPTGFFGASQHATTIGLSFAAAMLAGSLVCAIATLLTRGAVWTRWVFGVLAVAGLAVFVPALVTDLGVAGAIIGWQLIVLTRLVAAGEGSGRHRGVRELPGSPHRQTATHVLLLSLFITTLIVGFRATSSLGGQLVCLILDVLAIVGAALVLGKERAVPRWLPLVALAVVLAVVLIVRPELSSVLATLGLVQVGLLFAGLRDGPLFNELVEQFVRRPALLVLSTFAIVAGTGAVLLTFPAAAWDVRIGPLDALFTSVSATCVTGLIVVDTPSAFSPFGEAVILLLIQVGGIGMMVLSTFATVVLGGRLTLRGEQALGHVLELSSPGHAYRLVRFVVSATLAIEAVGAVLLTLSFRAHGLELADALWCGVFHSISAFCNAGFALQSDSIMMFDSDPLALGVHALLIVLGGLGFPVLAWLWSRYVRRVRERPPVQVRVVLWVTALLLASAGLLYAVLEWNTSLAELSAPDKLLNAAFQSVTLRTAGFNSVDVTLMRPATILLAMVYMFIGAAPGGTAGGVKVTTLAVLAAAIPQLVGSRGGTSLFGRSIPATTLQRSATIAFVATAAAAVSLFLLLITEDAPFEVLAFEVVSALGTVGLSLGVTASLTGLGKAVIIATMFIGRVGPLTLALALGSRAKPTVTYPETRIMVG
ncbi:MAG TPA: potassium transporter TrkG [Enhygromyxa sp.]|nr:potassium transporter TrkG [Enhygromyxa sp.]